MDSNIKILIADDDKSFLYSIEKFLTIKFQNIDILKAENGNSAYTLITGEKPQIIICDQTMPGLTGLDLLKKVRSDSTLKDSFFILITGMGETELRKKSFDLEVDDFILKPIDSELFLAKVHSAIRFATLQNQIKKENSILMKLAEELEKELQDIIKLSVKFLQARIPASFDMLKRVADASVWIATSYGESTKEELRDIEISAFLSQAGRIFLPDSMLKMPVMSGGRPTDPIMYQVPTSGSEIISSVRRFKNVSKYINHVYENFDGSGIPERLKSWQIPFPSRIIRVALDYQEFRTFQNKKSRESIELIKKESQRLYDHRVVILMEHYVKSFEPDEKINNEVALQLIELRPGMTLTRDIYTNKGLKLLPVGSKLTQQVIDKIINLNTTDPILGNVYVKNI